MIVIVAVTSLAAPLLEAQADGGGHAYAQGRILVQTRSGLPEAQVDALIKSHGARRLARRIGRLNARVIEVPPQQEERIVAALRQSRHVKYAEVDRLLPLQQVIPNDPKYAAAWHLAHINAADAWDGSQGEGITVAVLDTGVNQFHPDLGANLVPGWNVVDNSSDTSDVQGHGTLVAGIVGAVTDNGVGVASVGWNARVMPVRVTDAPDGSAYVSDIANGLVWAADHGARVANISYAVSGSGAVIEAAQYMRSKGGVVAVAAGNSGTEGGFEPSPALIAVSATNKSDLKTTWSSFGAYVDLAAPGASMVTTTKAGGYGSANGTSFSSPVVAATAALVLAVNPRLTSTDVEALLRESAVDLGVAGPDPYYGSGRVDAGAAVALAQTTVVRDVTPPTVAILAPAADAWVNGLVPIDVGAHDDFGVMKVQLYVNTVLVAESLAPPYGFSWDSTAVADGEATLVVHAWDAAGNKGVSDPIVVGVSNSPVDNIAPRITISAPAQGAIVSGPVTVTASATDNVGVKMVKVLSGGKLLCAGAPSVSCTWNVPATPKSYTVTATAKDAANNTASTTVTVVRQ
ncbi:MAG: S8 family serine peptidase [Gammaproteobacteria bacterium]